MVIVFLIVFALICLGADILARSILHKVREQKLRREREAALATSLTLDFTREAKTLKRVEVDKPAARILCVDDETIVLDSFRKILVLDGYAVDTVETGQEALGLIQTQHYDFVFTDLRMPAMDGVEVAKAVKHMRPDIDVIIITGFATIETAVECMKHGAMDYVQKPFTDDELGAFVRKALIRRNDRIAKLLKPTIHVTRWGEERTVRAGEFSIAAGVLVSTGHCWAGLSPDGSVKVGLDDFAAKLIGRIDAIEWPSQGSTVRAGEALFTIRQGTRRLSFLSPVSGRVVKVSQDQGGILADVVAMPYRHWLCIIDSADLDADIRGLKIGNSAAALFQDDIARFLAFLGGPDPKGQAAGAADNALCMGALEKLDDEQWAKAGREFFGR